MTRRVKSFIETVNVQIRGDGADELVFWFLPEGAGPQDKQRAIERSKMCESLISHERSNAPIVERKHGKTLGEFLSAVSLPVPPLTLALVPFCGQWWSWQSLKKAVIWSDGQQVVSKELLSGRVDAQ
jgi:hypothetical protein